MICKETSLPRYAAWRSQSNSDNIREVLDRLEDKSMFFTSSVKVSAV